MICRIWHGWTTPHNAPAYEAVVREKVIPDIEARRIRGFQSIDLMKRVTDHEVEFVTIMWFDNLESIVAFMGENYEVAHVPEPARKVLARFDERSAHYDVIDRRNQSDV